MEKSIEEKYCTKCGETNSGKFCHECGVAQNLLLTLILCQSCILILATTMEAFKNLQTKVVSHKKYNNNNNAYTVRAR